MKKLRSLFVVSLFLGVVLYGIYKTILSDYLLRKEPTCAKAVIYDRVTGKTSYPNYLYSFTYKAKEYTGLAQENDNLHIGDTICIVFYESYPFINKPLFYFKKGDVKCKCQ